MCALDLSINRIWQNIVFCTWLLCSAYWWVSSAFTAWIRSVFLFFCAEYCSIVWTGHGLLIHAPAGWHMSSSQVLTSHCFNFTRSSLHERCMHFSSHSVGGHLCSQSPAAVCDQMSGILSTSSCTSLPLTHCTSPASQQLFIGCGKWTLNLR